jgi:hypothetical protein
MSTETAQVVDPLSQAASNLEAPRYPTLAPDRIARFKITKAIKGPVKGKPNNSLLTVTFSTEEDLPDTDGKTLRKGFSVYARTGLTPTEGGGPENKRPRTLQQIAEELGMYLKWCGLHDKTPRNLIDNPSIIEGFVGDCRIGLTKETAEYPASNTIKLVLPA